MMIRRLLAPLNLATWIYMRSRMVSTCARTARAGHIQASAAMISAIASTETDAQHGRDDDQDHEAWYCQQDIHDNPDNLVDDTAGITGDKTHERAQGHTDHAGDQTDLQRRRGAVNEVREHISALLIGP